MQVYQQRVVAEKVELDDKRARLGRFIGSEAFNALPVNERHLLVLQNHVMGQYSDILGQRIACFS